LLNDAHAFRGQGREQRQQMAVGSEPLRRLLWVCRYGSVFPTGQERGKSSHGRDRS
jgi:hypothetical protein